MMCIPHWIWGGTLSPVTDDPAMARPLRPVMDAFSSWHCPAGWAPPTSCGRARCTHFLIKSLGLITCLWYVGRVVLLAVGWIIFLGLFFPVHFALRGHDTLRGQIEVSMRWHVDHVSFDLTFKQSNQMFFLRGYLAWIWFRLWCALSAERPGGVYL